jgi:hypothetical protein
MFFNGEGLTTLIIQTLPLKEVPTLLTCLPGHPFFINTVQGTGTANAYAGVTSNGAVSER